MKKLNFKLFITKKTILYFWLSTLMTIFQVIGIVAIPVFMPYIDQLANSSESPGLFPSLDKNIQLVILVTILIVISLLLLAAGFLGNKFSVLFAKNIGIEMRRKSYQNIQNFTSVDVDYFGQSSIINRLVIDVNNVMIALESFCRLLGKSILIYFGGIIGLVILIFTGSSDNAFLFNNQNAMPSYAILLLVIGITFLLLISIFLYCYCSQSSYKKTQEKLDDINFIAQENVIGQKAVKSFVLQDEQFDRFSTNNIELRKWATKAGYIMSAAMPTVYFFLDISMVLAVWFSSQELISQLSAIFLLLGIIITSLVLSIVGIIQVSRALPSSKRIIEICTYTSDLKYPNVAAKLASDNIIEIKNMSFKYPNSDKNIISNINLSIKNNEKIGIIGPTGSGKSTLINLILRMYDCTKGEIKLKNVNVKKLTKHQLKSIISFCPQTAVLFEGTIKSNIIFGKSDATEGEIETAAKKANLYDFVQTKEDKFNSHIEQRGKNLSGGQKQRLCLARTLIKDSPFLILDDSTSSLDMVTEKNICAHLINNEFNQTIILASQRVSAIKNFDRIIVMDRGKIIGFDTHKNLIKSCEYYSDVVLSQLGQEEIDNANN